MIAVLLACLAVLVAPGCVPRAQPAAATIATTPPPWRAPRDAVSHIDLTGLPHVPLDATGGQRVFQLTVTVDGAPVEVPAFVGIDRIRAVQAAAHTHDASGTVWLEGEGGDRATLADFFVLWGVRFDARCLGAACGGVRVLVDGAPAPDPTAVRLAAVRDRVEVSAVS